MVSGVLSTTRKGFNMGRTSPYRRKKSLKLIVSLATALILGSGRGTPTGAATPENIAPGSISTAFSPVSTLETAWTFQLPRPDYRAASYAGRDFLSPSNHLGEDSAHPHYTPIYAIANGVVKVAQTAQGYGRAVVIEHRLPDGTYVTSIYGHLCGHQGYPLIRNGSLVTKGQLIGYIGSDDENGDGREHLHLGIRVGRYDGYFCGYTGTPQCTASRYHRPTEFINARRNGLNVVSGISLSPSSPVVNSPITLTAGATNNHYYGGNFSFRLRISAGSTVVATSSELTRWLNPRDSTTLTFDTTLRSTGTYQAALEVRAPGTETWWPIPASGSGANPRSFTVTTSGPTTPAAPSNLRATTDTALRVLLFWTDNSSNETGFKIERKTGTNGSWTQIALLGANAAGYANTGLPPGTNYVYRVRATNTSGDSPYSNEVSITTVSGNCYSSSSTLTPGLSLSGDLSSTDCYSSVRTSSYYDRFPFIATAGVAYTINMTSSSFDTYLVLKSSSGSVIATNDDADGSNSRIVFTPATSGTYIIEATSFTSGATGSYTVSLSSNGGSSGLPAAPTNLRATTDSALRALLTWTDNSSNETGFKIERKTGTAGSWAQIGILGAGATGFTDTGLPSSTTFVYRVRASNGFGDSSYSNEAAITTASGGCSSSTSAITSGQSLGADLSSTDCYSSVRTSSYYDRFTFVATAGVSYTIVMSSSSFDTYLVLKDPSGSPVASNDDADGSNSRILHTAATSGTYTIEATSFTGGAIGPYTVSLASSGGGSRCSSSFSMIFPSMSIDGTLAATDCYSTVRTSRYHDKLVFAGAAGVSYTIVMTSADFDAYLILRGSDGVVITENDDGNGGRDSKITFIATSSAVYTIEATSFLSGATGSYTVSMER
jgi:murein DD-endopeptidase MepM/ murein hydrolase activator NlpD